MEVKILAKRMRAKEAQKIEVISAPWALSLCQMLLTFNCKGGNIKAIANFRPDIKEKEQSNEYQQCPQVKSILVIVIIFFTRLLAIKVKT